MATFKDLTGQKFNRLSVIELSENVKSGNRYRKYWLCKCDCGKEKSIRTDCLMDGKVQSCGCLRDEKAALNVVVNHTHKKSKTRVYKTWQNIKKRCYNENDKRYNRYGGRGIKVCDEWNDPETFINWALSNGYSDELTIDRIDNNGNYEPSNCKWSNSKEQSRNRSTNHLVEYNGKSMTIMELSENVDISYKTLLGRYHRGDRGERLIRPLRKFVAC